MKKSACAKRWYKVTGMKITDREARLLDMAVLVPTLTMAGTLGKKLPTVVRYGLISIGLGLLAWNAFDVIDNQD